MKQTYFIIAILLVFADISSAQEWVQTNGPAAASFSNIVFNKKKDIFALADGKLVRTTDHGVSWKRLGSELLNATIGDIIISDNNDVYISNYEANTYSFPTTYRSTDNGDSWQIVLSQYLMSRILSYHDSIYVGVGGDKGYYFLRSGNGGKAWDTLFFSHDIPIYDAGIDSNGVLIVSTSGCVRSTDGGRSWSDISSVPKKSFRCVCGRGANIFMSGGEYGVYSILSTDDGLTWKQLPFSFGVFAASPSGRILFSGKGILKYSDDDGDSWNDYGGMNQLVDANGYYSPVFADGDSGFFASIDGKLFHASSPGTDPWHYFQLPLSSVVAITAHPDESLIASTALFGVGSGTFHFSDNWMPMYGSTQIASPNWFVIDSNSDVIGGWFTVTRLPKGENKWNDLPDLKPQVYFPAAIVLPDGKILLATGSDRDRPYQSIDNGVTWNQFDGPKGLYSFALNSSGDIFAGGVLRIYRSHDNGLTWQTFVIDDKITQPSAIGFMASDVYGDMYAFYRYGVYRSLDNGETWSLFELGLPPIQDQQIYNMLSTPNGTVFVATDSGIFKHEAQSCNWSPYSVGLTTKKILSLAIDKEGRLYAGSDGCGVFKSTETFNIPPQLTGRIYTEDVDFGTVAVGDTACKDIFIKNLGLMPFTLSKSFIIVDPIPFSIAPQSVATLPIILDPKDSVLITICFHPPQKANYTSEIDWGTDIDNSFCTPIKSQSFLHGTTSKSSVRTSVAENNFIIHPNPVSENSLTVSFSEAQSQPVTISVFDVLGKEVFKKKIMQGLKEFEIPLHELSQGVYYVRVETDGVTQTKQFIKVK